MKKILLILACLPMFVFADDCADAYRGGLNLYKQGKYAEAQVKFIAVAKICGDYSDVHQYLKNCNQKLVEEQNNQTAQIFKLQKENRQLNEKKSKLDNEINEKNDKLSKASYNLISLRRDSANAHTALAEAIKTIGRLRDDSINSHDEILELNNRVALLDEQLTGCQNDLEVSNQSWWSQVAVVIEKNKDIRQLREENIKLEKQVSKLQEQIEKFNSDQPLKTTQE